MKAIEGIDLGELFDEVEAAALSEQRQAVSGKIRGIALNVAQWQNQRKDLQRQIDKLDQKITKGQDKLKAIREGKWEVLEDDQQKSKEGKGQAPADDDNND